jgi:hypothetical protein
MFDDWSFDGWDAGPSTVSYTPDVSSYDTSGLGSWGGGGYDPGGLTLSGAGGTSGYGYDTSGIGNWAAPDIGGALAQTDYSMPNGPNTVNGYPTLANPTPDKFAAANAFGTANQSSLGEGVDPRTLSGYVEGAAPKDGITSIMKNIGEKSSGGKESLTDKLTKSLFQDKDGDLSISKIVALAQGLGALMQSKKAGQLGKDPAPGQQTPQQLQAQLVQNNTQWTPQQAQWSNQFFQTPNAVGRGEAPKLIRAGEGGIKSIVPSRSYAEGGGIGAPGDERYGNVRAIPRGAFPQVGDNDNLFDAMRRKQEREAGMGDKTETMQEGRVNKRDASMSLKEIGQMLKKGVGMAEGGAVTDKLLKHLIEQFSEDGGGDDGVTPVVPLLNKLGLPQQGAKVLVHGQGVGMAVGGPVDMQMEEPQGPLSHGDYGLVAGGGDGQSDTVPINASAGEYVFDAETVSMLGNGSTDAGADILDKWREYLRGHKRSADPSEIGPESKDPSSYLPEDESAGPLAATDEEVQ